MTVGEVIRTPEERAMDLLFKLGHSLTSRDAVERGGATIVGTGTTFGLDGMTLNGSGNLSYSTAGPSVLRASRTTVVEFTLGFSGDDGAIHYFFDYTTLSGTGRFAITKNAANAIVVTIGGTTVLTVAYATWNAALVVGRNVLVLSSITGSTTLWLNGTSIGTSATAWAAVAGMHTFAVGAAYDNGSRFTGTIHRFEIYGNVATAVDEPYLRAGTLISALNDPLAVLPGTSYYKNDAGLYVTDVGGRIGGTALMGSDGATAAQFPTVARSAGLVRGFGFDGGDQVNLGDSDLFSFTDGAVDKPFTLACLASQTLASTQALIAKSNGVTAGEYQLGLNVNAGIIEAVFLLIDETGVAYIGRTGSLNVKLLGALTPIIATCSGSGTVAGLRIYAGGIRADTTNTTFGVYARMRNTARTLRVGNDDSGVMPMRGSVVLPCAFDYEASPLQAKAIGARLLQQSRRG
ncbi:MAG: hypothetical protein M0R22_00275 [Dehalococcoidia bacterium]|nr:hypothetical protein [Dehalococcoidia bacterium]